MALAVLERSIERVRAELAKVDGEEPAARLERYFDMFRVLHGHRADGDDAAALAQESDRSAYGCSNAADIDGEQTLERRKVRGRVVDGAAGEHAGIVDEDIEPPEFLGNRFHETIDLLGVGAVALRLKLSQLVMSTSMASMCSAALASRCRLPGRGPCAP